jgi:MtrB/PioB family decaheme-associated outer membrane protein
MKTSYRLFLLSMLSGLPVTAAAADAGTGKPDTSKWQCEGCAFEQGWNGSVDAGVGNVSDKSFKFGEYTGLNKQGGFFIGDAAMRFRGAGAYYWNINASDLGLQSRSLDAEGGRQGKYKLILKYEEIPHYLSDSAQTPFIGSGGASLTLPAGFPAATTGAMPLASTLQRVDLSTQRKRLAVGGSWIGASDWEYAVKFSHETKDGMKRTAGAFFANSAQLVEPVDYVTDQVDASASYTGGKLQAKFAYYGSTFRNGNHSLTWQDPFRTIIGEGAGQLALPPENQFHQLLASAGYQLSERTRASADIAWGRMTQNDSFLASTLTRPVLLGGIPALPESSLNGRAATLDANLKLTSAVTQQLRLNAIYTHNDRDNQTPQATFPSISTDMFLGAARTNLPYSFTQDKLKLSADYRFTSLTRASVGFDHDRRKRTFQEVNTTNEDTLWGKVTTRAMDKVDMTLKLVHGERKGSSYQAVPGILQPENPLLRKFSMANRDRDSAVLRIDIAATDTINVGLGAESSKDDYSDSAIGLTSGRDLGLNADVSWTVTEETSLHVFANRQQIKSAQRGSQAYSVADWTGENKDTIVTLGIGVKHAAIKDKLDIGADYTLSRSHSDISANTGASNSAFPDLSTSLDTLKLYANYRLKDNLSLLGGYWYERYDSKNWMLEGVTPGTIPNVLTLGEQPPRYHVNVVRLAVRYRF